MGLTIKGINSDCNTGNVSVNTVYCGLSCHSRTVALTKNGVSAFSAQDMKVRVHARARVSTAAQSFFICRTHANYDTTPVGFSEREFIEADRCVRLARPVSRCYQCGKKRI